MVTVVEVEAKTEAQWRKEGWKDDEIHTFSKLGLVLAHDNSLESYIEECIYELLCTGGGNGDTISELAEKMAAHIRATLTEV